MRYWLAPSLLRRVLIASLCAVVLIWCLVMVLNFILQFRAEGRENRVWVEQQGQRINRFATQAQASEFLSLQADYYYRNNNKKILIALLAPGGKPVFFTHLPFSCSGGKPIQDLRKIVPARRAAAGSTPVRQGSATPLGRFCVSPTIVSGGKSYVTYRYRGRHWSLCAAFPAPGVAEFISDYGSVAGRHIMVAVCLVLPALLLAIKTGLMPLARLSHRLESRHAEDLTPVHFDATYLELKPLVAAMDALLLRLRNRIAHEQTFVENAAHELRTPLAVIAAQKDVLAHATNEAERLIAQQQIGMALGRAQHLVGQLLELARLDRAGQVDSLPLDVAQLTQQALAQLASVAKAKGARLSCQAEPGLMYALEQQSYLSILMNLIDNAIRYGQPGVRVEVLLRALTDGALELSVSDDGPGITRLAREQVFERFYRGQGHDASGSGLGLAIAREAARRLGGSIDLHDGIEGKGCRFVLVLPGLQKAQRLHAGAGAVRPQ